jgi:16S rRNA A1518/A1519 N6-dimethyltransferase RsmA/KsgA/DIM1 with predicted DNA glycosylase/AP lyase activity
MGFEKNKIFKIFESLSIEPNKRPEEIGIENFYNLWISLRDFRI